MPSKLDGQVSAATVEPDAGTQATLAELGPDRYQLQGVLDLSAVARLAKQTKRLFKSGQNRSATQPGRRIEIDLGGIERSNSAVIALLLDWVDQAAQQQIELVFKKWPQALERIAAFSNVDQLLGIETRQADDGGASSIEWTNS
ncbi:MAG: STAS domain-containing protein [Gammaproteobacteria bacterium]|nr:STAS domain-containing protein [Gammaproteobacteria bacterium]